MPARTRPAPTLLAAALLVAPALAGCAVGALVGGMAASSERQGSTEIDAEYTGLVDTNFAVVVSADRVIQADHPSVVPDLTLSITKRLEENAGAAGRIPGDAILFYQASNPSWTLKSPPDLGRELGVDRLVYIELLEYRLHEPGNRYLWDGRAAGRVRVFELDTALADIAAFERTVEVRFPDAAGYGPAQIPQRGVSIELSKRFLDLSAELFYTHERANARPY